MWPRSLDTDRDKHRVNTTCRQHQTQTADRHRPVATSMDPREQEAKATNTKRASTPPPMTPPGIAVRGTALMNTMP